MFFNYSFFSLTHFSCFAKCMQFMLGFPRGSCQINNRRCKLEAQLNSKRMLQFDRHFPWLKQPSVWNVAHSWKPAPNKYAFRVVILRLLNGVVNPRCVDARGARLHLQLAPVDAGFIV